MAGRVTDKQRKKIEEAIAAALLLIARGSAVDAAERLTGQGIDATGDLSRGVQQRLRDKATETAGLIQAGVNKRYDMAGAQLPADATQQDRQTSDAQTRSEIDRYNAKTLIPYLVSYGRHQGVFDVYDSTDAPDGATAADGSTPDGRLSMRDASLWQWGQRTGNVDDCTEADAASPAPWDVLVSLAGGEPPVHRNCQCILEPVDGSNAF